MRLICNGVCIDWKVRYKNRGFFFFFVFCYNVYCLFGIGFLKKDEMEWVLLNVFINIFELG